MDAIFTAHLGILGQGIFAAVSYAPLSTRNKNGLHPNFRGLGFLGDSSTSLSPMDALNKALQAYSRFNVNPAPSGNSGWLATLEPFVASGQMPATPPIGPDCTGIQAQSVNLFQTASGLALGTTSAGIGILAGTHIIAAAIVPVIGWVVAGVGAIISLIGTIFAHHAAAVRRDLNFGCSVIPAVNNAFSVIFKAVQSGQMNPGDAASALPEIYSQYMSAGGASGSASGPSSIPGGGAAINDSPYCNSNCLLSICLYAMVLYWQEQFQTQAAQAAASAAEVAATSTAPGTLPAVQTSQGGSQVPEVVGGIPPSPAGFSLSQIPAWGWIALAAVGAWAVAG